MLIAAQVSFERLDQSIDIITERAANLFYNGEYKNCIGILNELVNSFRVFIFFLCITITLDVMTNATNFNNSILKNDPYHCPALIIFIGCLIELKEYSSK